MKFNNSHNAFYVSKGIFYGKHSVHVLVFKVGLQIILHWKSDKFTVSSHFCITTMPTKDKLLGKS